MDEQKQPAQTSSTSAQAPQKKGGYGKRPMWQWVLIYLVVAIIVYGLVYLLFIKGNGNSGY